MNRLKLSAQTILVACCLALLGWAWSAQAAPTIWDGPPLTFTEASGVSGSFATNQDRLTADVWLTRDSTMGLYNAFLESGYAHFSSPAGTEWAYGALANWASLTYTNWEGMFGGLNGGGPIATLNQPTVVHLISDDIYVGITMLDWGQRIGGFTYQRTTPHPVPIPLAVSAQPGQVVLSWTNAAFALQSATNVTGPYTTITGAVSPYTNSLGGAKQFFRLVN